MMSTQLTTEDREALVRLGSATVHEAQGQRGALDPALKPLDPRRRLAGPALTVDCRPSDNLVLHLAITKARPGDVLVVDAKAFCAAGPWGDILTLAAQRVGIAGMVIDGAVRDADAIVEMGFPIFALGLAITGTLKNQPGAIDVPITCGGQRIEPGDIIVGDRDGIVVVRANEVKQVLEAAEDRERKEMIMRDRINAGETTLDILNLRPALARFGMI